MTKSATDWVLTLKFQHVEAIRNGLKKYIMRTRLPAGLRPGDRFYIAQAAWEGRIVLRLTVCALLVYVPKFAWYRFHDDLGISKEEFNRYTRGRDRIYLVGISNVEEMPKDMTIHDLGLKKAPRWFCRIE